MSIASFPIGPIDTNCHVVYNNSDALVVDPGGDMRSGLDEVLGFIAQKKLKVLAILLTHFHFDHIYGVADLKRATNAPVYGPKGDAWLLETELGGGGAWGFPKVPTFPWEDLKEGQHTIGSISFEVMPTPGHTPGSISIYIPAMNGVLTGDLLFFHSVGRTDFPRSSSAAMKASLRKKIFVLPPDTDVYPGHGPNTNVDEEISNNPYLAFL